MINATTISMPELRAAVRGRVIAPGDAGYDETRSVYANFLGDEGAARVREAYPGATWERLAAIKARYDPANLFRRNHNVPPVRDGR